MMSVGADARVQYRLEFVFIDFDGSRHARRNIGEEQLSVDGEGHAVAACVGGIADDSGTAFARTFATRPFFSGNVFGVGIGEQRAWIGEQRFAGVAVFVDRAHPQRGDGIFRTVGTQEQHARAICNRAGRTWRTAGESQSTCFFTGELSNRICHIPNLSPFHISLFHRHPSHSVGIEIMETNPEPYTP